MSTSSSSVLLSAHAVKQNELLSKLRSEAQTQLTILVLDAWSQHPTWLAWQGLCSHGSAEWGARSVRNRAGQKIFAFASAAVVLFSSTLEIAEPVGASRLDASGQNHSR
jgi:hypothetical protein